MRGLQYALDLIDRSFGISIRRARTATTELDQAINTANRNIGRIRVTGQQSFGSLGSLAKKAGVALAGAFAVGSVIAFGSEVTRVTAQFEGYKNAIEFASGQDGAKNIQFLDDTIKTLNLDMTSSYKGFQTLTGSLKGTALEGQATRDIFEAVGVAATVMNLSAEQSEGAFLALSQMASKGKVQAEELRGQLGERIPGAFKIAADAMGVTQAQLNKMLDNGEVYAEDFLPKFAKQLKTTFEDGLPKAANSMQAAINRKNNALLSFKLKAGEAFRPLLTAVLEAGTKIFGFFAELMSHLQPVQEALAEVGEAFAPFVDVIKQAVAPFAQFTEGSSLAEIIMKALADGIRKLMPVFELLGEILGFVYQNYQKVTRALWEAIQGLYESGAAGEFLSNIMDTLTWAWGVLQPAISVVADVLAFAVGVIGDVVGAVMQAVNALFEWGKKTEWAQRLFNAFVSGVTTLFHRVGEIAMNVLGSVGDLLVGIFTLDVDKIKSALGKGFDAIKGAVSAPKALISGAIDGWNKELGETINKEVKVSPKTNPDDDKNPVNLTPNGTPKGTGGGIVPTNPPVNNRVAGGGSGGNSSKHNVFNIQSFVKELTIQTTNLKEDPRELKKVIEQIFNEAWADILIRVNNA